MLLNYSPFFYPLETLQVQTQCAVKRPVINKWKIKCDCLSNCEKSSSVSS